MRVSTSWLLIDGRFPVNDVSSRRFFGWAETAVMLSPRCCHGLSSQPRSAGRPSGSSVGIDAAKPKAWATTWAPAGALLCLLSACASPSTPESQPKSRLELQPELQSNRSVDNDALIGPVAMEVGADNAIVWIRANQAKHATLHLLINGRTVSQQVLLQQAADFTGHFFIDGLQPQRRYDYQISLRSPTASDQLVYGSFQTAPAADEMTHTRLIWSGDLAGQNVCRDASSGFTIMPRLLEEQADLFIGLGDMIYADGLCKAVGRFGNAQVAADFSFATSVADYHANWRYTRTDPTFEQLLRQTNYYAIWDDHEVVNDFGPDSDFGDFPPYQPNQRLLHKGLRAYLDYNPNRSQAEHQLYRKVRWGKHLELFFLDTRQYRDPNQRTDSANKTLLGNKQRQWLVNGLTQSDATWKLVISSVPIAIPTGWPPAGSRDGWASLGGDTGFEQELATILDSLREPAIKNMIWLSTDVHFAAGFRYRPFSDQAGFEQTSGQARGSTKPTQTDLIFHEFVAGPLSAGLFPNQHYDRSFLPERLFFFGPESPESTRDYAEAVGWFNYGAIDVAVDGELLLRINNGYGETVRQLKLQPAP